MVFRFIVLYLVLLFSSHHVSAQTADISIDFEETVDGYVFYARNISSRDYHVLVKMTKLIHLRCECTLPYSVNLRPGRTRLFRLKREGISSSTDFSYSWSYGEGHANPEINQDVHFMLPIGNGRTTKTLELTSIKETFGKEPPATDYYAIGFKMNSGDTVFAARGGVVRSVTDGFESRVDNTVFSRNRNQVVITHKDKTMSSYSVLKNGSTFVNEGDRIEAGQPLAIVAGENYTSGPHVRFATFYLFFDEGKVDNEKYEWVYLKPVFAIQGSDPKVLNYNEEYTSTHSEHLIVQEMSKREIKRRAKKKDRP